MSRSLVGLLVPLIAGCTFDVAAPTMSEDPGCRSCHGSIRSSAPPRALDGSEDRTHPGVGAHEAHLFGSDVSGPVACEECHRAVTAVDDPGHLDDEDGRADVLFGAIATRGGTIVPVYDRDSGTCASTYCHGSSEIGGTVAEPVWNEPGSVPCGGCHGLPPPAPHPPGTDCAGCHGDVAGPELSIADRNRHADGILQIDGGVCDSCHGQDGESAPPRDLLGRDVSDQVGAHETHLRPTLSAAVACETCHLVPSTVDAPGHLDTPPPAEVTLSGLAAANGAAPDYAPDTLSCGNTYCHGGTIAGGSGRVAWNATDGSATDCASCHGMPPPDGVHASVSPNACAPCHDEVVGPAGTILNASLHVDGVVQVTGEGCTGCHGAPPAVGVESYPGSAGAHEAHAGRLGFACATCHGNNGSGPEHNEGDGVVLRENVQIRFAALGFPGGTTTANGGVSAFDPGNLTCKVGCHNPVVGNPAKVPNLNIEATWVSGTLRCVDCHDQTGNAAPAGHDIVALGNEACRTCHDMADHTRGTARIADPDPGDAHAFSAADPSGLCKTCHDGGGGTAFNGRTARDVSPLWNVSSHGSAGLDCMSCHTYHASPGGPAFVDANSETCLGTGCHADVAPEFQQVPTGPISRHRIEGGPGIQIGCVDCHNPHLVEPGARSAIDPDDPWTVFPIPDSARTQRRNNGNDYTTFCLRCHDGNPPARVQGALNIAQALQGGTDPSEFRKENDSLHRNEHDGYNCQNCHATHGSPGTDGINRGRLLLPFMEIRDTGYREESSCGTRTNGVGFGCHDGG